jgi:CHASE2 domain-containing sensor protein
VTGSGRDAGGLARPSRRLGALAGLLIALAWLALVASGVLARGQWAAYHLLFELRGPLAQPASVAVVAVDEASLAELGAWPVPRTVWAELVDALLQAGATVVGLDVAFVQPGADPAADRAFARALAAHPDRVVLAANFQPGRSLGEDRRQLVLPLDSLRRAAAFGIVDLPFDADGAVVQACSYRANILHGPVRRYWPGGELMEETHYRDGVPTAPPARFDAKGSAVDASGARPSLMDRLHRLVRGD